MSAPAQPVSKCNGNGYGWKSIELLVAWCLLTQMSHRSSTSHHLVSWEQRMMSRSELLRFDVHHWMPMPSRSQSRRSDHWLKLIPLILAEGPFTEGYENVPKVIYCVTNSQPKTRALAMRLVYITSSMSCVQMWWCWCLVLFGTEGALRYCKCLFITILCQLYYPARI